MKEEAARYGSGGVLFGVVTRPGEGAPPPKKTAFVLVNSGIVHRVGPNRVHVNMARDLAALGYLSFRIDLSGIGDSPVRSDAATIGDRWAGETRQAMDYLMSSHEAERFVLIGNCSGAAVSLLTATLDERVAGIGLVNLEGPRKYLRYYVRLALGTLAFWRRLLKGRGRYRDVLGSVSGYAQSLRSGEGERNAAKQFDVDAALESFAARDMRLLVVYCSWDPSLDFFRTSFEPKLERWIAPDRLRTEQITGMNHDFTLLRGQQRLRTIVADWARDWAQ